MMGVAGIIETYDVEDYKFIYTVFITTMMTKELVKKVKKNEMSRMPSPDFLRVFPKREK